MPKIFIVVGTKGEYSDRHEWPARAYSDEARACNYAERAKVNGRDLACQYRRYEDGPGPYLTGPEWLEKLRLTPLDPKFDPCSYDANDVDYFVVECELEP